MFKVFKIAYLSSFFLGAPYNKGWIYMKKKGDFTLVYIAISWGRSGRKFR